MHLFLLNYQQVLYANTGFISCLFIVVSIMLAEKASAMPLDKCRYEILLTWLSSPSCSDVRYEVPDCGECTDLKFLFILLILIWWQDVFYQMGRSYLQKDGESHQLGWMTGAKESRGASPRRSKCPSDSAGAVSIRVCGRRGFDVTLSMLTQKYLSV